MFIFLKESVINLYEESILKNETSIYAYKFFVVWEYLNTPSTLKEKGIYK